MSKTPPSTARQRRSSLVTDADGLARQQDARRPAISGPARLSFAELKRATQQLYVTECDNQNPRFDKSVPYKFCKMTPLALHTTEAENTELVFADKAFDRAAIVIEKKL
ncbi:hypothetical protein ABBQ38_007910 [Trebouxia sp. C0009 RCD-2024]